MFSVTLCKAFDAAELSELRTWYIGSRGYEGRVDNHPAVAPVVREALRDR